MRQLRAWLVRLDGMFRKARRERELAAELESHLAMHIEENVRAGMSVEEARRQALVKLGGLEQTKEKVRDRRGVPMLETLLQDIRHGLRQLRRNPGFTTVALLTLALGIGANTAIFSVVDAILLRPLPYQDPQQLVLVQERIPNVLPEPLALPAPDVVTFARESHAFSGLGAFQNEQLDLTGSGPPERVMVARVTASLFALLGVRPQIGRWFTPDEDRPNRLVVLLSHQLWQQRFGGDTAILGTTISLDRKSYVVTGVMPANFEFPFPGLNGAQPARLWVPMGFTREELEDFGDNFDYSVIARLKPGVTLPQANADVSATAHGIQATVFKALSGFTLEALATPLKAVLVRRARQLLLILMGAVSLVLLIACTNVANLLFLRAAVREKEMAIRAALGAGRLRLLRGLLVESVVLAILGGALGLLIAVWGVRLLVSLAPLTLPRPQSIGLNSEVLLYAAVITLGTGLAFGLLPALAASDAGLNDTLKEGGRTSSTTARRRLRSALVVTEVALSLVLLAGAGLLIRSFERVRDTDPGFAPQHLLSATVALARSGYGQASSVRSFYQRLLLQVSSLPGVRAAGASTDLPLETNWEHLFTVEEHPRQPSGRSPDSRHSAIMGSYLQALGVPLIRGRYFTAEDRAGSLPVLLVSAGLAKRYWPGEDPVGKRIKWGPPESRSPWLTVVGLVGDVKQGPLDAPTEPHTYEPFSQLDDSAVDMIGRSLHIVVRAGGNPASLTAGLRDQLRVLDPEVPLTDVRTMDEALARSMSPRRFNTVLLAAFAAAALMLAAIGLYGVIAFSVSQRTHEIGLRMALGANKGDILKFVVGQGFRLTVIGVGIGLAGALTLTRLLSSLLYGVNPTDPLTLFAVSLILIGMALVASYIPARRATKVDPMVTLRHE